jgi:hypothetical protein
VAAPELTSAKRRGPGPRDTYRAGAHLSTEARSGAVGHVVVREPTSVGRCGHVVAPELTSQEGRARSQGTCGSIGAHISTEVRSGATGHIVASEPTSTGRCGPKLHLMRQRVDARPAPCLDLEFVCEGTRSSRHQQRLPGPP